LAIRCGREARGDVRWRTALIFRLGQVEAPGGNVDLLDRRIDDGGEAGINDLVGGHDLVSSLGCTSFEIEAARPRCENLRDAVARLRWMETSVFGWSGAPAGRSAYRSSQVVG